MSLTPPRRLIAALVFASSIHAQDPAHTRALINDARSHGKVGDALLSLDEGIRLHNATLARSQLSAAERKQIQGSGDVSVLEVRATVVATITLQRELTPVSPSSHGFTIEGAMGTPSVDLRAFGGFVVDNDFCGFRNVTLKGGTRGVTLTQRDAFFGASFEDVHFTGQSVVCLAVRAVKPGGNMRVLGRRLAFSTPGTAISIQDGGKDRTATVLFADARIAAGMQGVVVTLGAGGSSSYRLERVHVTGARSGVAFVRPVPADDRIVGLTCVHVRIANGAAGLSFSGSARRLSGVTLRAVDLGGSAPSRALDCRLVDAVVEDSRLAGPVSVAAGAKGVVSLGNVIVSGGRLDLSSTGHAVEVADSILSGVRTSTAGGQPVRVTRSRLIGGSLHGTVAAPLLVDRCHNGGASVGAGTKITRPLPAAQLGTMDVAPLDPPVGATLTLSTDLPPGLGGLWAAGLTSRQPWLGAPPLHIYLDLPSTVVGPAVVRLRSRTRVRLPAWPGSRGFDLFFQLLVVPDPGVQAPPLALPPGRRITIR